MTVLYRSQISFHEIGLCGWIRGSMRRFMGWRNQIGFLRPEGEV